MNDMRCTNGVERTQVQSGRFGGGALASGQEHREGRGVRTSQSVVGCSDTGGGFCPATSAADNCLGRGFPAVLSRAPHPQCTGGGLGRAGVEQLRRAVGGAA